MNNGVLVYSTENYVQYPMTNHNGKECEKLYITESLCCAKKLTQRYKSIRLQKKNHLYANVKVKVFSLVRLSVTPWSTQPMALSRPGYWSGHPFPSVGDVPNTGLERVAGRFFTG